MKIPLIPLAATAMVVIVSSCALSKGSTFEKVAVADELTATEFEQEENDESELWTGLSIDSDPQGAEVYINNRFEGLTPIELEDFEQGTYKITLVKQGYEEYSTWIVYQEGDDSYDFDLAEITGYLEVVVKPDGAKVLFGGQTLAAGINEVPVGSYSLIIRSFGFEEYNGFAEIQEDLTTHVAVNLDPAEFQLKNPSMTRRRFNPMNPGSLGISELRFDVSAPGTGSVSVVDSEGKEFLREDLQEFETWQQAYTWDGKDVNLQTVPDGSYRLRLTAIGTRQGTISTAEQTVVVDSTLIIAYRSNWSGIPGMLYAGTPDVLPRNSFQLGSLISAHWQSIDDSIIYRAPANLTFRYGMADTMEIDLLAGLILENAPSLPFFLTGVYRYSYFRYLDVIHAASSIAGKLTYHSGTGTDTLTNFSGFSLGLPTDIGIGPVSLIFHPEIVISPWRITYDLEYLESPPSAWMYLRGGFLVEADSISGGLSAALRSTPFSESFAFFSGIPHLQIALEIHGMLPGTQLILSGFMHAEVQSVGEWYLSGGGGLGFIN